MFNKYKIEFQEIKLDDENERKLFIEELKKKENNENIHTMPQIFINDTLLGGCSELLNYIKPSFDFNKLINVVRTITKNLNKVIDKNYYPTKETFNSNKNSQRMTQTVC